MKSKRKKIGFSVILGIFIALLSISINNVSEDHESNHKSVEIRNEINLKAADSEITIISPGDKTYTETMDGYFPATYGFEEDLINNNPQGWTLDEGGGSINVINQVDGHKNIVEFNDITTDDLRMIDNFDDGAQESGTVEMYVRKTTGTSPIVIILRNSTEIIASTEIIRILIDDNDDGNFAYDSPTGRILFALGKYSDDQWFHLRIDYECGAGGYMGLGPDRCNIYIDGIKEVSNGFFQHNASSISNIFFGSSLSRNIKYYIDAIGYSWDPDYEIGDNLYEGLLLSFNLDITPEWMGYSLDGQANKTILGNTTIPMPIDGPHTIQVFGNETGTMYKSDIKNFVVNIFNIITPENKRYTEPMSGYFPATYGFEEDLINNNPQGWAIYEIGGSINVISDVGGHKNIVEFNDIHFDFRMINNFAAGAQESGTVEMYVRKTTGTSPIVIILRNSTELIGSTEIIRILIDDDDDGNFAYDEPTGRVFFALGKYSDDQWFHLRIDFECGSGGYMDLSPDTCNIYIDGIKEVSNGLFQHNASSISNLFFGSSVTRYIKYYIDAIGYSWDQDYEIGDNLEEGLLLSFDCEIELDWIAYSLDGQDDKTIVGNITIPMPADGSHTIQVFGDVYTSEVRHFTVGTPPPPPPPPGDDDDDDDDEEEIAFLGPTLIIIGIGSAIGVTGIALYLIKKRKLVRE